jgi:predicted AAA+ superfamily ATPase
MVFLSGPRQSGKTTLVKDFLGSLPGIYLNWDDKEKLKITKCVQLVMNLEKKSTKDDILVVPAVDWLSQELDLELF